MKRGSRRSGPAMGLDIVQTAGPQRSKVAVLRQQEKSSVIGSDDPVRAIAALCGIRLSPRPQPKAPPQPADPSPNAEASSEPVEVVDHGPGVRLTGFVYFVREQGRGPVKVGWAKDVQSRVRDLQIAHSAPLVVLAFVAAERRLEGYIHSALSDHRIRGEWFAPDAPTMSWVEWAAGMREAPLGYEDGPGRAEIDYLTGRIP